MDNNSTFQTFSQEKPWDPWRFVSFPAAAITETQRKITGNLVVFLKVFNNLTHHSDNNKWMNK
jgi:hypothetical protein